MKKLVGSQSRLLIGIAFIFAIMSISNSCTKTMDNTYGTGGTGNKGGSGEPGTNEVWIQSYAFNPSTITVAAGTTITWTNKDAVGHSVTSKKGVFDSGIFGMNETHSIAFPIAGTYSYYCTVHPSMTGTVVVN